MHKSDVHKVDAVRNFGTERKQQERFEQEEDAIKIPIAQKAPRVPVNLGEFR